MFHFGKPLKSSMNIRNAFTAIALLSVLTSYARSQAAPAAEKPDAGAAADKNSNYLRVLRNADDEPIAMQTSIVSFKVREEGQPAVVVDLIGAVHVADKAYFRELNRRFANYDALLYELVAPEENNIPRDGTSRHPIGQMQQGLKSMLDLAFQLEEVDYTKPNFVHADMSPEEFGRVMKDRGESFLEMMLRMMGAAMATQSATGRGSDADLLWALIANDRALRLKRVMSTQFQNLDGAMAAIEGPNGSTIIGQRNKKALEVLRREMTKGKRRIGIFYGAGHLSDMQKRLAEEFGLYPDPKSIEWLTAWDMQGKKGL